MVRRIVLGCTAVAMSVFLMVVSGGPTWVGNVAQGQSTLPAPASVSVANGTNPGEVVVSWNAVAGSAYYRIGWMADEDYQAALLETHQEWEKEFRYSNIVNRGQTSRTVTRLTPGIKYWIIVGSHSGFYGGPQWSSWSEVTLAGASPQPGDGSGIGPVEPQPVGEVVPFDGSRLSSISSGAFHTCGVRQNGTIHCFGSNGRSEASPPDGEFLSVTAGGNHSCGIKADSTAECWGSAAVPSPPTTSEFAQVVSGDSHACGLIAWPGERADHEVICWGAAGFGRIQDWSTVSYNPIESVSAGENHNCALYDGGRFAPGSVRCWGSNESNQRIGGSNIQAVSAGGNHTCVLNRDGTARCKGDDTSGQSSPPVALEEAFDQTAFTYPAISAGGEHTCAIDGDGNAVQTKGTVRCWGSNLFGQSTPPDGVFAAISSAKYHTCGLRPDGTVSCWGDNTYGQALR